MADVVYNNLQYMTNDDVRAMAIYLKSLAPRKAPGGPRPITTAAEGRRLTQPLGTMAVSASHRASGKTPDHGDRRYSQYG